MNNQKKHRPMLIVIWCIVVALILAIAGLGGYNYYRLMYNNIASKDGSTHDIYVLPGATLDDLVSQLSEDYDIKSTSTFLRHSHWMSFHNPEPGHYVVPENSGNYQIIKMFKYGLQTPVKITYNNIRTTEQLSVRLGNQLLADSADFMLMFEDSAFLSAHGLTSATAMLYFLPNSYEVYWTASAHDIFNRMHSEYKHFWNESRRAKAEAINLTPLQVSTLASIVEEENSGHPDEWAKIAGLYINRLNKGMLLQADPTVKYAVGDFSINRVLNKHLETESPYNTYKVTGLPPGPIRMPSAKAIDAVLNAEKHNYLFMCADWQLTGYHRFARTSAEHAYNARRYQQELNKRKIYK